MPGVTWPRAIVALAASITIATATLVGLSVGRDGASLDAATPARLRAAPATVDDTAAPLGLPVAVDRAAASTYLATSGNSFSSPVVLTGYEAAFWFDNTGATVQTDEPRKLEPGWYLSRTLWVRWKAPANGTISVGANSSSSEDDLALKIYRGSSLTNLTRVGMNNDQYVPVAGYAGSGSPPLTHPVAVSVAVTKGVVYSIQLGSAVNSSSGPPGPGADDIYFAIIPSRYRPANDDQVNAEKLTIGLAAVDIAAMVQGATIETWEPRDVVGTSQLRGGSVWYAWTPPADAELEISTCGDVFKSAIAIFGNWDGEAGNGAGDLAAQGFDYNGNGLCGFNRYGATLPSQPVLQGVTYYIQVSFVGDPVSAGYPITLDLHLDATFTSPYIEKISPTSGSKSGGTTVTFTGQAFAEGMVVHFGSKSVAVGPTSGDSFTVKTPSHSLGKVSVTVTSDSDTSNAKTFTYK